VSSYSGPPPFLSRVEILMNASRFRRATTSWRPSVPFPFLLCFSWLFARLGSVTLDLLAFSHYPPIFLFFQLLVPLSRVIRFPRLRKGINCYYFSCYPYQRDVSVSLHESLFFFFCEIAIRGAGSVSGICSPSTPQAHFLFLLEHWRSGSCELHFSPIHTPHSLCFSILRSSGGRLFSFPSPPFSSMS